MLKPNKMILNAALLVKFRKGVDVWCGQKSPGTIARPVSFPFATLRLDESLILEVGAVSKSSPDWFIMNSIGMVHFAYAYTLHIRRDYSVWQQNEPANFLRME